MNSSNKILNFFWGTLPVEEQEVYALLSIPIWFSEDLAAQLGERFNSNTPSIFFNIIQEFEFVSRYENKGWFFEKGLREYLLSKADIIYKKKLEDIHEFIDKYYWQQGQDSSAPGKREFMYLAFYHRLQVEPVEVERSVLLYLDRIEENYLRPVLKSLIYIYQLPPGKFGKAPIYLFLQFHLSSLENKDDIKILKYNYDRIEIIKETLDKDRNRLFLKQIYRLLIFLIHHIYPKKSKNILRKLRKVEKKLTALLAEYSYDEEGTGDILKKKKSFTKFEQIRKVIERIVHLHQKGLHESAFDELEYLKELHEEQRDKMCKSFSQIAQRVSGISGGLELQEKYLNLAIKCNKFDPVALNAKAELLAKMGNVEEALTLFDQAHQVNPHDVVALNASANLLAKSVDKRKAIEKYQHILEKQGKNNPYTMCGLGFLLLHRNQNEQDIFNAKRLFEKAKKIPGSETISFLGLWIAHARLGEESESRHFKDLFEKRESKKYFKDALETVVKEEKEFEKIKDEISAENMVNQAAYKMLIAIVLAYVQTVLMRQQLQVQIQHNRF